MLAFEARWVPYFSHHTIYVLKAGGRKIDFGYSWIPLAQKIGRDCEGY
jgi:hypothetical protein